MTGPGGAPVGNKRVREGTYQGVPNANEMACDMYLQVIKADIGGLITLIGSELHDGLPANNFAGRPPPPAQGLPWQHKEKFV